MARSTPTLRNTIFLFYQDGQLITITVESRQWFEWLGRDSSTTFTFQGTYGSYTARKERVGNERGGWYWKAYRKAHGKLYRSYLGKSEDLTLARLNEVAQTLSTRVQSEREPPLLPPSAKSSQREYGSDHVTHKNNMPLLETRLHPPQLSGTLIERTRLLARLESCLSYKLTLVQAPAGFGKTTLVNQWLTKQHGTTVAWVSLEAGDNDPLRFWRAVITACGIFFGQAQRMEWQQAFQMLSEVIPVSLELSPVKIALTILLNSLVAIPAGKVLVLDDYQVIHEAPIHEMATFFIDHLPPHMHVILLSRAEPDLPLLRWRASGILSELRGTEIRFSEEETQLFVQRTLPDELSPEAFIQLESMLEGWVAGLRLLCFTLSRWRTPEAIGQAIFSLHTRSGSTLAHRSLLDYLVGEILKAQEAQSEEMQHFLLQTSMLSRLSGPLCDAVTGRMDSAIRLETIEKAGLFLETIDGEWYRYHALFAEAMQREARKQLGEERLADLSRRASAWYEQQNMLAEAVETALLSCDTELVGRLIEQVVAQEPFYESQTLLRWLKPISEEVLRRRPMLSFIAAIAEQATKEARLLPPGKDPRIERLLSLAEDGWQREGNKPWIGAIRAVQAVSALEQGPFSLALEYAQQALALLPEVDLDLRMQLWHSSCLLLMGMERLFAGAPGEARPLIFDALTRSQVQGYSYLTQQIQLTLGRSHLLTGEFRQARDVYQQVTTSLHGQEDHEVKADTLLSLAWLMFEWNDLTAVEQLVQQAIEHIQHARHQRNELQERAMFQLMLLHYARGDTADALTQISAQFARIQKSSATGILEVLPFILDWQGRLFCLVGDHKAVEQLLTTQVPQQEQAPSLQKLLTHILRGRLLLMQDRAQEALSLFMQLREEALVHGYRYYAIQIQLMLALAHMACKQTQQAHHWLGCALKEAQPEGFLRLFLDEGEDLAHLLRASLPTIKNNALRVYAKTILHAFVRIDTPTAYKDVSDQAFFEPLSVQEQRVLHLLVEGQSNQEIARELIISVNTVKDHVKNLYRKMGVNNRLQASMAARRLNLINDPTGFRQPPI